MMVRNKLEALMEKCCLTPHQKSQVWEIRRKSKNRLAAAKCRKRKIGTHFIIKYLHNLCGDLIMNFHGPPSFPSWSRQIFTIYIFKRTSDKMMKPLKNFEKFLAKKFYGTNRWGKIWANGSSFSLNTSRGHRQTTQTQSWSPRLWTWLMKYWGRKSGHGKSNQFTL